MVILPHRAKHGLVATKKKTATAEVVKMGFIWDAFLSAVARFEERQVPLYLLDDSERISIAPTAELVIMLTGRSAYHCAVDIAS